jgi:uncharacterized protein with GYD domain
MLHMLVNTHDAGHCAFRQNPAAHDTADAFERFERDAAGNGLRIVGSWVSRPAHEVFALIDAPDGHVIDNALLASGLVGLTHSRVLPVIATADVTIDAAQEVAVS